LSNPSGLLVIAALSGFNLSAAAPSGTGNQASIRIQAPVSGSVSRSHFVGVDGYAPPATKLEILDENAPIATILSEEDGHFDSVVSLNPGDHKLRIRLAASAEDFQAEVRVHVTDHGPGGVTGLYENLREGDIILSRDLSSLQVSVYDPHYTHAGLYLGPDPDGTPLILEPVTYKGSASYGVIAAIPIEESLAWMRAQTGVFRLKTGLRPEERNRLLAWGRTLANREASFWSVTRDFGALYRTWLMWDFEKDQPRNTADFDQQIAMLRARLKATDRFDCVTLVWRAYNDATEGRVDLSTPNEARFQGAGRSVTPRFLARIKPVLLVPDTFALNEKLVRVAGK
jgi:hypothetical protein